jgi:hypothetical protein
VESVSFFNRKHPTVQAIKADLKVAIAEIANNGRSGVNRVIDMDNFIKMWAMEFILHHNDGFTTNRNNVYFYNDAVAKEMPNSLQGDVRFKMIPWGLDQIFTSTRYPTDRYWRFKKLWDLEKVASIARSDPSWRAQTTHRIGTYANTVFSRANLEGPVKTFIDLMETKLATLKALTPDAVAEISTVRLEVKKARGAALAISTAAPIDSTYYYLDYATGNAIHASSEVVGADFELVHRPPTDATDRWTPHFASLRRNEANGRYIKTSSTIRGSNGRLICVNSTSGSVLDANWDMDGEFMYTGAFNLHTQLGFLHAATNNPAPSGRQRIELTAPNDVANASWFFLY